MTQQVVGVGAVPFDGTGQKGQVPWAAFNTNSTELYKNAFFFGLDTGIVNAPVVTLSNLLPGPAATFVPNVATILRFTPGFVNNGPATLAFAGNAPVSILKSSGAALTGGELSGLMILEFNGASWVIVSPNQSAIGAALYPQTAVELAAGVTPTLYFYPPGNAYRYGYIGDGVTDDSAALARAVLISGTYPLIIPFTVGGGKVVTPFTLPNNFQMLGSGRPTLFATVPGLGVCSSVNATGEPTVNGIIFKGASVWTGTATCVGTALTLNSTTAGAMAIGMILTGIGVLTGTTIQSGSGNSWVVNNSQNIGPITMSAWSVATQNFGAFSVQNTGLLTIVGSSNVRVTDNDFSLFQIGPAINGSSQAYVERNQVFNFAYIGIQMGQSTSYVIFNNDIHDCTQYGSTVFFPSYCINMSGFIEGGQPSTKNFVIANRMLNNPAWDGVGCHDVDLLTVADNDIRNCRQGIDLGHLVSTNICRHLKIDNNYVEGPAADQWNGLGVQISGIDVEGFTGSVWTGTASITGTAMTITVNASGTMVAGTSLTGTNVPIGCKVVSGSGNNWVVNIGLNVASTAMIAYACVEGCSITNNTLAQVFNVNGMVGGGFGAGVIAIAYCNDTKVSNNIIMDCGNATSAGAFAVPAVTTGIFVTGLCNRLSITDNSLAGGTFPRGGIRFNAVLSDVVNIAGNSGIYSVLSTQHIVLTSSTIGVLDTLNNPSNVTAANQYTDAGCTISSYGTGNAFGQFTATLTGCTTAPTSVVSWVKSGSMITLSFQPNTAVSNAITCTLTGLPGPLQPQSVTSNPMVECEDNTVIGGASYKAGFTPGSGTISLQKNNAVNTFTNVGTKGILPCTVTYPCN